MHFRPVISRNVKRRILCSFNTAEILVICYSLISVWFVKTFWPHSHRFPAQGEILWDPQKHQGDDSRRSSTFSVGYRRKEEVEPEWTFIQKAPQSFTDPSTCFICWLLPIFLYFLLLWAHCLMVTSYSEWPDLPSLIQRGHHHCMPPTMSHNQFLSWSVLHGQNSQVQTFLPLDQNHSGYENLPHLALPLYASLLWKVLSSFETDKCLFWRFHGILHDTYSSWTSTQSWMDLQKGHSRGRR